MNRVTLTEADLQTIINALCQAQSACQGDARRFSQAGEHDQLAKRLCAASTAAARDYSELADKLIAADVVTSSLALVDDSPPARVLTLAHGGKPTH